MDLPEITKTEVIRVEDGDVLAVFVKGSHLSSVLERVKQKLTNDFLPKKITVEIINADAIDLKVIRVQ